MSESLTQCDNCETYVADSLIRKLRVPSGYLELCNKCFDNESRIRKESSDISSKSIIPQTPYTHNIQEQVSTKYTGDFAPHKVELDLSSRLKRYVMEKHQEYFNQEIEENANLSVEQLRDRILTLAEEYHGAETEAIRIKTKMHGASSRFNKLLEQLTETEKSELRENDKRYIPTPLANPLKQIEKKQKLAASAEDNLRALFPNFTDEQITMMLTGKK